MDACSSWILVKCPSRVTSTFLPAHPRNTPSQLTIRWVEFPTVTFGSKLPCWQLSMSLKLLLDEWAMETSKAIVTMWGMVGDMAAFTMFRMEDKVTERWAADYCQRKVGAPLTRPSACQLTLACPTLILSLHILSRF